MNKYNRNRINRIHSSNVIPIEDLMEVQYVLERLQEHYSSLFIDMIREDIAGGISSFDAPYEGKISLKDTVKFAMMDAYNGKVQEGTFLEIVVGEMRTLNSSVHNNQMYEEFSEMFDTLNRVEADRTKAMLENKDIRNNRKGYIKNDESTRNLFYGLH